MKNKFLVLLFALVMILGVVGCSKKANDNANTNEQTAQEDTADKVVDENYYNVYTKNYESSIVPLEESYYIYGNVDSAEKYYKDHDYPGNKEYLNEVKAKSDKEFRRIVGEHIVLEKEGDHDFKEILKKLDKELNIERKDKNR